MFEGTNSVFTTKSVSSNISDKSFNLSMQNSYCDHRNFDSEKQKETSDNLINFQES